MFRKTTEDLNGKRENTVDDSIDTRLNDALESMDAELDNIVEEHTIAEAEEPIKDIEASVEDKGNDKNETLVEDNEAPRDSLLEDISETVSDKPIDEDDSLGGRVISVDDDRQDIMIPDGPSKLDGEVLLVRRTEAAEQPGDPGVKVRRVKADRAEDAAEQEPHGFLYSLLDTLRFISLGLLVGILLVVFVVQRNDVYGESMEPTLFDNDAVFVEMISVYLGNFERGAIVTIDAEGMEGYYHKENLIKRVIGLPGETVDIVDGLIYINGNPLMEPYLTEGVMTYVSAEGTAKGYDHITLGPDQYLHGGQPRCKQRQQKARTLSDQSDQIACHCQNLPI